MGFPLLEMKPKRSLGCNMGIPKKIAKCIRPIQECMFA